MELCGKGSLSRRKNPRIKGIKAERTLFHQMDKLMCEEWSKGKEKTLWCLNCLVYCGAVVITKRVSRSLAQVGMVDPQQRKAEATQLRREVGWVQNELKRQKTGAKATPMQNKILSADERWQMSLHTKKINQQNKPEVPGHNANFSF